MKTSIHSFFLSLIMISLSIVATGQPFRIKSPDSDIQVIVDAKDSLSVGVFYRDDYLMGLSGISMRIKDKGVIGRNPDIETHYLKSADTVLFPVVKQKSAQINDRFNELEIVFTGGYSVIIRVYDDGFAYRFATRFREFPWRIMVIAGSDGNLITNQLPWLLSSPCRIQDPSWIRPGKVAWDWWNANNIYGVDFKSGIDCSR